MSRAIALLRRPQWTVFIISAGIFFYESLYIRILAAILVNSQIFLVISLALTGYGAGSLLYSALSRQKKLPRFLDNDNAVKVLASAIMLSVFMVLLFVYFAPYMNFWLYILPVSLPFFFTGFTLAHVYSRFSRQSSSVYASDLAGGILGLLAGIVMMNFIGVVQSALLLVMSGFLTAGLTFLRSRKVVGSVLLAVSVILTFIAFNPSSVQWINRNFTGLYTNPHNSLTRFGKDGLTPEIIATEWNAFSRTDLIELGKNEGVRIVTIDGAANASMIEDSPAVDLSRLRTQIDYLPFIMRSPENAVIIGAGGGRDVQLALQGGVDSVDAVEINRSSIKIVNDFSSYNGGIFSDERVRIHQADGRSYMQNSKDLYDLVFLSLVMTGTAQAEGLVSAETYIYTKEALESYISRLEPDGQLTLVAHEMKDLVKLLKTLSDILLEKGYLPWELRNHLVVAGIPGQHGNSVMLHSPTIVFSPKSYSDAELDRAESFLAAQGYLPVLLDGKTPQNVFSGLLEGENPELPFNYEPATDNKPFFYHYSSGVPPMILGLMILLVLAAVVIWGSSVISRGIVGPSLYFSLSGLGFMLIEVVLIQKMTLYLEHSMTSFAFIVIAVLLGAGTGGLLTRNGKTRSLEKNAGLFVAAIVLILFFSFLLFKTAFLSLPLGWKMTALGPLLLLMSFFQGMIFPAALSRNKEHAAVYYGVNTSFSVIGSVLGMLLIFVIGNTFTLLAGAFVYIVIFLLRPVTVKV